VGLSVSRAYDASHPIFRVLRAFGWGPLLNLGYYPFGRPLALLNFLVTPAALVPRFRLPMAQLRLVERAVALLQLAPGHRVLDVGCGRGASSFLIASEFPGVQVIGIDLLPEHITVARTLYGNTPHLTYEQGDAMKLDHLKPRTVDRALCLEAAFHFSDRARFLERLSVLLKPGGRAVIVDFMWQTDAAASACGGRATDYLRRIWR
jgi:MPBQ/MSBQ methyltransferase